MAKLNVTLDQEEIIGLLAEDRGGAFGRLLQESLNAILRAESDDQIGAGRYERSEARNDSRNGVRGRPLTTRVGTLTLSVPRHREVPFATLVFDNYARSEAALVAVMAEMVCDGVSTRKVAGAMELICGKAPSKSAVSEACGEIDAAVEAFRGRPLDGEFPFVMLDATYLKVRVDHRVVPRALMVAIGFGPDGRKQVLGFGLHERESAETWGAFVSGLLARGLHGVRMVTSDAHEGLVSAVFSLLPGVPWQRCQYHFARNVVEDAPKRFQEGLRQELREMFGCATLADAERRRDGILRDYGEVAEGSMRRLAEGFDSAMTVMLLPEAVRRPLRTSNHLERTNEELKRRSRVVGVFPNEASVVRLMGSVLMDRHDHWQQSRSCSFYRPDYNAVVALAPKLEERAAEQRRLLKAV